MDSQTRNALLAAMMIVAAMAMGQLVNAAWQRKRFGTRQLLLLMTLLAAAVAIMVAMER